MNAVAVAGLSIEKGLGTREIFVLLGDGDAWVVANVCGALINAALNVKQNPTGQVAQELQKVSISTWSELGQIFASLPLNSEQRMNILKFLANALSHTKIIASFIKSSALGSLSSKIWEKSPQGQFLGTDEECHALLVVMNNLVVSSKPEEYKNLAEDSRIVASLANVLTDLNHLERVAIGIQIANSICQEPSYVKYFAMKDKPFIQAVIQLLKSPKIDSNTQLRLSRLCGSLMQNYEGIKQLTNGGVFKFYAGCIANSSNDETTMAILATLANLALSDHLTPNLPQVMEESRVLVSLQDLLTKSQTKPETRIRAGIAISNLMTVETLQAPFAATGGIKTLLATANKTNQAGSELDGELFQKSLSALFHLSLYYDSIRTTMVQEGLLKSLGNMLSTFETSQNSKNSHQKSGGGGLSKSQVESLEKAQTAAMKTLYNVSMTDGTEVEFVKQNVVAPLLAILKTTSQRDEDQNISAAILENLSQNQLFQDHLLATGGVDSVVSLVTTSAGKVQERAARLVARLAVNGNVRRHLQKTGAAAKLKSASTSTARAAIDMALHNLTIPVEDDKIATATLGIADEEDPLLAKMASEFDLDDDGSIGALDRLLHETGQSTLVLSSNVNANTGTLNQSPRQQTKFQPSFSSQAPPPVNAHPPVAKATAPPNVPEKPIPAPTAPTAGGNAKANGPPALPPKPPPKPSAKKMNAARRALMSQPPRPSPLVQSAGMPRTKVTSPQMAHRASPSTPELGYGSKLQEMPSEGDEAFEDRGLRKESYLLVGSGDAVASGGKKKRGGLLTSLKSLFSSSDSHEAELMNSLHSGPWQVDESTVSQKCPSLIYDYYEHWCESCKRDGSLCIQSSDELRKLRMRLIRSKEPKSFAPPKTRDRANSDPVQPATFLQANQGSTAALSKPIEIPASTAPSAPAPSSPPQSPSSTNPPSQHQRDASLVMTRPPPPTTIPPMASMPIPQKIVVSPRKPSVSATAANAKSQVNAPGNVNLSSAQTSAFSTPPAPHQQGNQANGLSHSNANGQPEKMPAHPPQPSLLEAPKKALPTDADPEMVKRAKMHVKRTHVAQELLTTEGTYMQNLGIILKKFQAPLTSSLATPKPLIAEADIKTIFGSVEIIYNINLVLIERLNMKMRRWTSKQTLGDVFIYMADWLKIYTDYINNYDKSQSTLLRCKEESPRFAQFLMDRSLDPVCALRGLETFLVTPIQRPPRYSLLLRELIKNTDETHPDWEDLNRASVRIEAVTAYLNEKRREFESRFKMFALAHSLTSSKIRAQIVQPHRENLLEAEIEWKFKSTNKTKSGSGRLYLLNDAFLVTKITSKTRQKLVRLIPLSEIAATIPPFSSGVTDDPHLRELTLLHLSTQDFILINFPAVENRDQMYNQYLRLQPSLGGGASGAS
jgi:hypothetical protein